MDKRIIKTYEVIQTTRKGRPIAFWLEEFRGTKILKLKPVKGREDIAKGSDRSTLSISTIDGLDDVISLLTAVRVELVQWFAGQTVVPAPPVPVHSFQTTPPPPPAIPAAGQRPPPPPPPAPAS